jgi:hypothetical protein
MGLDQMALALRMEMAIRTTTPVIMVGPMEVGMAMPEATVGLIRAPSNNRWGYRYIPRKIKEHNSQ